MALKKSTTAVAGKSKGGGSKAVSMNPDTFVQGGLPDDFNGVITKARAVPFDYNGQAADDPSLAIAITITPDEDSGFNEFTQMYSVSKLSHFGPSNDGEELVDLDSDDPTDHEGVFIIPRGDRTALAQGSNYALFLSALAKAEFPADQFSADVRFLEGIHAHFSRQEMKKRSGLIIEEERADGKKRDNRLLVITELLEAAEAPKPAKGAKVAAAQAAAPAKTKGKPAPVEEEADDDAGSPYDEKLTEIIVAALGAAEEGSITKGSLTKLVMKKGGFGPKDQPSAIKRAQDPEFLNSDEAPWVFDEDDNTLTAIPE